MTDERRTFFELPATFLTVTIFDQADKEQKH